MTRTRRFGFGVITGYLFIVVNILYTMGSIPLALSFLGKEEFGLWALTQQIAGYLMLLDLGMSSAVSRFVANHKEDTNGGEYGSLLLTGGLVFIIQGGIIALAGSMLAFIAPQVFAVPIGLANDFRNVLVIISCVGGCTVACRGLGSPLWAFHRLDISNGLGIFSLATTFAALWIGFQLDLGIYSFAFSGVPALVVNPFLTWFACWKNGYYPTRHHWGWPRFSIFSEVFKFGKDLVLLTMGSQMVNASQIIIISQAVSLEAAATFAVGTKCFTMGQQFVFKLFETSAPALTEIFLYGGAGKFNSRFWNSVSLTAFLASIGSVAIICGNRAFIDIWTSGAVKWTTRGDVLLGFLLIATSLTRCLIGLFGITGNLSPVRRIYLIEGCIFVGLAIPVASHYGIDGVIFVSLITHLFVTGLLSLKECSKVLHSYKPVIRYLLFSIMIASISSALSLVLGFFTMTPEFTLAATVAALFLAGIWAWFILLNYSLREELFMQFHQAVKNLSVAAR